MQKEFKKHSFENGATDSFRKLLCSLQGPSGMASQECPTTSKAEIDDEEDEESEEEEEEEEEEDEEEEDEATDSEEEEDLEQMKEGQGDDEEEEEEAGMSRKQSSPVSILSTLLGTSPFEILSFFLLLFPPVLLLPICSFFFFFFQRRMEIRAPYPHYRSPLKRTWNLIKGKMGLQRSSKTKDSQSHHLHWQKSPRPPPV